MTVPRALVMFIVTYGCGMWALCAATKEGKKIGDGLQIAEQQEQWRTEGANAVYVNGERR